MSQSYTPGTILSIGFGSTLEQVIVLSDGRVATKTFGGKPVERRDMMSLADWEILAISVGEKIQTDYLPINPDAAPVAQEAEKAYAVGTKLTWKHTEGADRWFSPNSRTAIVLKNGILQVREVINSETTMTSRPPPNNNYKVVSQKFFSSLADWKAQLPVGGSITATEVTGDFSVPSIKRKAQAPVKATTDVDYVKELQQRFSVHAKLEKGTTLDQKFTEQVGNIRHQVNLVEALTSAASLSTSRSPQQIREAVEKAEYAARRLRYECKRANRIQRVICAEPSRAKVVPVYFTNAYRQRLVAFVNGREIDICADSKDNILGIAGDPENNYYNCFTPKTGKTFAELGIDLKADGKPRLKAYYRRESIEI